MMSVGRYHEYTGGCSAHRGIPCTPGVYHDECGGYHEYTGGVQYTRGYYEYTGGCSVHRGDTMSTLGGYHEYTRGFWYE